MNCSNLCLFLHLLIDFPEDRVPVVLAPLLYPESPDPGLDQLTPRCLNMPKSMVSKHIFCYNLFVKATRIFSVQLLISVVEANQCSQSGISQFA